MSLKNREADDCRVIDYLVRRYPAFTKTEWLDRIKAERVLLDDIPVRHDQRMQSGQVLTWVRPPWEEPDVPRSFAVLYRDESLLAVAKPAGLPTLPGGGRFMDNTLMALVRLHFPGANPLHRLGRGTSGIVLFSLSQFATKKMFRAWNNRNVLKIYRALISGSPQTDAFDVSHPIGTIPHRLLGNLYAATAEGKPSLSHVRVLERRETCSLVEVRIETGRPHQIRIHLSAAGFPLIGDPLYKTGGTPYPDSLALPSDQGYFLHNILLGFPHPDNGKWLEIHCMPPPVLRLRHESNPVPLF
jgi:23S rRNA pseudouridine1911/1915/1917 synthase